jgi:hypothetical protein
MATYRVKVSGWVTFEAPDDLAARTTAHQLHLGYDSDLDAGVVPDESELVTEEPERVS